MSIGRESVALLNLADKEAQKRGDQFIASEMVLLALTEDKSAAGQLARENGLTRKALEAAITAVRGGGNVNSQDAEGQREALKKAWPFFPFAKRICGMLLASAMLSPLLNNAVY